MEPAKIDWKNLDSKFVEDALYEHINAPKWVDFLAPHHHQEVDDDAWFCRPDCKHPKTAGDFLKLTPNSKVTRSSSDVFQTTPLGERNQRDANLKRRGLTQPSGSPKIVPNGDCENHNPNPAASSYHIAKSMKAFAKSSSEKKKPTECSPPMEEAPGLKGTLSARNLFAGKDIFNQITEFCSELKKLATRVREKESAETVDVNTNPVTPNIEAAKEVPRKVLGELSWREERTPLFEVSVDKSEGMKKGSVEKKLRRRKMDDGENIPMSLDLENVKRKGEGLTPIRTYPPSPQCFSATRPPTRPTPPKPSRSKPMEKGILQEADVSTEATVTKEENEARSLDMFWFLKPCTLSST